MDNKQEQFLAPHNKILVFTATYNEVNNIQLLLSQIWANLPQADILVVDDNSPDGTGKVLDDISKANSCLSVIHRPGKLGLGSAHYLAMIYAIKNHYDFLVTMDADLSHDPKDIPRLLEKINGNDFVIGSRYAKGGTCDYAGYRKVLSIMANFAASNLTGIKLKEFTTSFRAFNVHSLAKVNFNWIGNFGYSFFLESVFRLHEAGFKMQEVPIHFYNRHYGESKIPKFEIIRGILKLSQLSLSRFYFRKKVAPSQLVDDLCAGCNSQFLFELYPEDTSATIKRIKDSNIYKCSSMDHSSKPQVAECLKCGLVQIPLSKQSKDLTQLYGDVVDEEYLKNIELKKKTFSHAYQKISPYIKESGSLLEIGSYCGLFIAEAKKNGWHCTGIEPSKWAYQYAKSQDPISTFINGDFETVSQSLEKKFDLIVSWDVLEHVKNPAYFLTLANGLLKQNGVLALSTLDMDSWMPKLLGKHWPWIMEMHSYYFKKNILKRMLEDVGFTVINVLSYRHYSSTRYMYLKFCYMLPSFLQKTLLPFQVIVPNCSIPVTLGDIKLFIVKKD